MPAVPAPGAGPVGWPPDHDALHVFRLHGVLDVEGRPLGEHRAPGGAGSWAPTEYRPCPYPGSRRLVDRPMNVSALRQMAAHWPDILELLTVVRMELLGPKTGVALSWPSLWQLVTAIVSLPAFLVHRRAMPIPSGDLPVAVAGLYKASLGVKLTIEALVLERAVSGSSCPASACAQELLAYTERSGLFIGRSEVCAGPPRLVEEFVAILTGEEAVAGVKADVCRLLGPAPPWCAFAHHAAEVFATLLSACVTAGVLQRALTEARGGARAWADVPGPEQELAVTLGLRHLVRRLTALQPVERAKALREVHALTGVPEQDSLRRLMASASHADEAARVYAELEVVTGRRIEALRHALAVDLGWPPRPALPFTLTGLCGLDVGCLLPRHDRGARRPPYAELWSSPAIALLDEHDTEGRPAVAEALLPDDVRAALDLRPCPYPDSRFRHALPMNRSALGQMARHWSAIVGALGMLHRTHQDRRARARPTLADLTRVAYAAAWLPLYLVFRRHRPLADGEIPAFVSGLHKASVDVATTLQLMLLEALRGEVEAPAPAPDAVLRYVERRGFLVGARGVCAGPSALILEYLTALIDGAMTDEKMMTVMSELIGDVSGFWEYSGRVVRGTLGKYALWAILYGLRQDDARRLLDGALDPSASGTGATEIPGPIARARHDLLRSLDPTERRRLLTGLQAVIAELGSGTSVPFPLPPLIGAAAPAIDAWRAVVRPAAAFFADNERAILECLGYPAVPAPFGEHAVARLAAPLRESDHDPAGLPT